MSVRKKQRDAKFIIYQSLYIIVIALLGIKGVTIMDIPDRGSEKVPGKDTVIEKSYLASLEDSLKVLDSIRNNYILVAKLRDNEKNVTYDTTVNILITQAEYRELLRRPKDCPPESVGTIQNLRATIVTLKRILKECCGRDF